MIPYEFTGPYANVFRQGINCMDVRHIYMVYDILVAGKFRHALEIGTADGACTTAFVEAMKHTSGKVTTCDMHCTQSAIDVCSAACDQSRMFQLRQASVEALHLSLEYDFVMVDGSHKLQDVRQEILQLARIRPRCVMGHDTSATDNGIEHCEGAKVLREFFEDRRHYQCCSEDLRRDGELTHRGLFFATTDAALFDTAQEIFAKWSAWEPAGVTA